MAPIIGADAAPLLIEIFAHMSRAPERRQALESLAVIQTPEVAAHFATLHARRHEGGLEE